MSQANSTGLGAWTSRWTFILAATGSAVGLGNVWKFPYMAGENGGGAFVLVYLVCLALVGLPLLLAEAMIGRRTRHNPVMALHTLVRLSKASRRWVWAGRLGVIAGFLILSFYSVVGGMTLAYIFKSAFGAFVAVDARTVVDQFESLQSSALELGAWHLLFLLLVLVVSVRGINHGLERALRVLMPMLFGLLVLMLFYAAQYGDMARGAHFLFDFAIGRLGWSSTLEAMGHAFFTLSLGMGVMIAYGAYMSPLQSIGSSVLVIAVLDTLVALMAGMVIFPLVFAHGLDPAAGFGLMFNALPLALGQMPFGQFFGSLFFVLITLAAWSSAISVLEPAVAWLQESRGWPRRPAVWFIGLCAWVLGLGTVLSFNRWADLTLLGQTFFGWINFLSSSVMLPLTGFLIAVFVGWYLPSHISRGALSLRHLRVYRSWRWVIRWVVPAAVVAIFLFAVQGYVVSLCEGHDSLFWCEVPTESGGD